jgi:hypothetical protein
VCRNATLFALVAADVDHHYNDNRNIEYYDIGRDVSPITYARPGLNVSRGSIHSAIPIGYDHKGDHNASGSIHSSGSDGTSDPRRLARDLSGLVSSPEVARPDTQHRRQAFRIPAGGAERSFQEIDAREERCPPGMTFKRTTVMYDRGASWMLQQSHESDPDTNVMIHGRETLRTNDMMLNDICNRYPSPTIGARKILQADTRRNPSGVQYSADRNRVMVHHDGRAHYNDNTPITTYNNNTPITTYNNNTPIHTYNDNTPITTYNNNTPHYHLQQQHPHYHLQQQHPQCHLERQHPHYHLQQRHPHYHLPQQHPHYHLQQQHPHCGWEPSDGTT